MILLAVSAFALMAIVVPGCSDGSGNPPVGSISSVKKSSDATPPPAGAAPAPPPGGKFGGDR
jgi:hypothetical protein